MSESMRDRVIDVLVMTKLSDHAGTDLRLVEGAADALLAAFPWLADTPSDVEAGARAMFEDLYTWTQMVVAAAGARYTRGGGSMAASADPHTPTPFDPKEI